MFMFNASFRKVSDTLHLKDTCNGSEVKLDTKANNGTSIQENIVSLPEVREPAESKYNLWIKENFLGCLRLNCNIVEGWLAQGTVEAFNKKIYATISGSPSVCTVHVVPIPVAPYLIQPPSNAVYFQIDISNFLRGNDRNGYFKLSIRMNTSGGEQVEDNQVLMSLTASLQGNRPLNKNPCLHSQTTVYIPEWDIQVKDKMGLRIDEFNQNKPFSTYSTFDPSLPARENLSSSAKEAIGKQQKKLVRPTRYSRIALTESLVTNSVMTLSTNLSINSEVEDKEFVLAILLRADRTTKLSARLVRNKKVISCVSFNAESHWTEVRRQFDGSLSLPRHKTAEYKLEIDVSHRGRGYVDIVACSVSTNPSIQKLLKDSKPKTTTKKLANPFISDVNYIRNGDFSRWSRGFIFDQIQPRQETADSWRIDCRLESSNAVQLSLFQLREHGELQNGNLVSMYGLHICTQSFEGPMRLVSVIGREFQDARSIIFKLDVIAPSQIEPVRIIKRILLLGKSVGDEHVLHIFSRNMVIRFKETLEFKVTEHDLVKIREKSSDYSTIQVCIELEQNVNIVISSVQMVETVSGEIFEEKTEDLFPIARENVFEDPAITEQAAFLKGLDSWHCELDGNEDITEEKASTENVSSGAIRSIASLTDCDNLVSLSVDIVVPIHNALDAVKQCLQSIVRETSIPYTLHCIDDASSYETYEWLKNFCQGHSHINLHANEENIGYTRTVNRGLRVSTADWVCVLNSDAIVTKNWLERLVHVATSTTKIGIVSPLSNAASYQSVPRIHIDDKKENGWCFNPLPENISPNDMAEAVLNSSLSAYPEVGVSNGFCQLINRKMLDEIGTLDEENFPRGFGEENDLCARAVKAGWTIRIADDTYVFHIKSQSFGHDQRVQLSKQGKIALSKKHPDIDWNKVTTEFQNLTPLVELRHRLIKQGL